MVGVVVLGSAGATAAAWSAHGSAREAARRSLERATVAIQDAVARNLDMLRGVDAMAADGEVTSAEFKAFADDVLPATEFEALAHEIIVPDAARAEFERTSGLPIRDKVGAGFVRSAVRTEYVPVVDVWPLTDASRTVLGFDVASDPGRAEALRRARTSRAPSLSAAIGLASSDAPGVFAIHAIVTPDRAVVGFVSSALGIADLASTAETRLGDARTRLAVRQNGQTLYDDGVGADAQTTTLFVAGQAFEVAVGGSPGPSYALATSIALATAAIAGLLGLSRRRAHRLARFLARSTNRSASVAAVARALSAASTHDEVLGIVATEMAAVVRAGYAEIAMVSGDHLVMRDARSPIAADIRQRYHRVPLDTHLPATEALRTGEPVLVPDVVAWQREHPALQRDAIATGSVGAASYPLYGDAVHPLGVVTFVWARPPEFSDGVITTLRTLAELSGQTLARVEVTAAHERAARRNRAIAELGERLSAAHQRDDIVAVLLEHVPGVLHADTVHVAEVVAGHIAGVRGAEGADGVESAVLAAMARSARRAQAVRTDVAADREALHLPLRTHHGTIPAVLSLQWSGRDEPVSDEDVTAAETVAQLAATSFERAALYEAEHSLVLELQSQLLSPLPVVDGLETAVRYDPATTSVGIGGDWFDGAALADGSLVVVVGDVTGHGVQAVALMAQLRSMATAFARSGMPLEEILPTVGASVDEALVPHGSALLLHVDAANDRLGYVSFGHPYPLLRAPDGGVQLLRDAQHALLGIDATAHPLVYVPFEPGAIVVAYTDGVVERRQGVITDHIDALATRLAAIEVDGCPVALLDELVDGPSGSMARHRHDDAAAVLVRRALGATALAVAPGLTTTAGG